MPSLPCLLCLKKLKQRTSRRLKPYFVCNSCGVQLFIRREQGIEKLKELTDSMKMRELPTLKHAGALFEIQSLLAEIDGIKEEIKKIESPTGFFRRDKDKVKTRQLLKARLKRLYSRLEALADPDTPVSSATSL
jgi:hypothetical protein